MKFRSSLNAWVVKLAPISGCSCRIKLRPRLLSDNGPCYLSKELKTYLDDIDIKHIRSAPYHPQTHGKIERYHRSIKNVITLHNYYFPTELEQAISEFVNYYNNKRYHESLNNLTPGRCLSWAF